MFLTRRLRLCTAVSPGPRGGAHLPVVADRAPLALHATAATDAIAQSTTAFFNSSFRRAFPIAPFGGRLEPQSFRFAGNISEKFSLVCISDH
jgi:hypothetical protein